MSIYLRLFNLRNAYRKLLEGNKKAGRLALEDLRDFCRADRSCVVVAKDGRVDTHATAVAEGRREVFLKILQMLNLTDEDLLRLRQAEDTDE
jgi:hypothetical protein